RGPWSVPGADRGALSSDRAVLRARALHGRALEELFLGNAHAARLRDRREPRSGPPAAGRGVRGRRYGLSEAVHSHAADVPVAGEDDRVRLALDRSGAGDLPPRLRARSGPPRVRWRRGYGAGHV